MNCLSVFFRSFSLLVFCSLFSPSLLAGLSELLAAIEKSDTTAVEEILCNEIFTFDELRRAHATAQRELWRIEHGEKDTVFSQVKKLFFGRSLITTLGGAWVTFKYFTGSYEREDDATNLAQQMADNANLLANLANPPVGTPLATIAQWTSDHNNIQARLADYDVQQEWLVANRRPMAYVAYSYGLICVGYLTYLSYKGISYLRLLYRAALIEGVIGHIKEAVLEFEAKKRA